MIKLIFGNIKPLRCKNCNKHKSEHKSKDFHCPFGSKHPTVGYTQYSETVFQPKERKLK